MFIGLNETRIYKNCYRLYNNVGRGISKTLSHNSNRQHKTNTSPYSGSKESVIYVGDERITYGAIDGNTLKNITRGTLGTSIENLMLELK